VIAPRPFITAVLSAGLAITPCRAVAAGAPPDVAAVQALRSAVLSSKTEDLIKARATFEMLSTAEPKSALGHYWVAVADWRLVPRLGDDKAAIDRYCTDGIANAERALEADPKLVEAIALKASLQGMSLTVHPDQMMTLGAEMQEAFARAKATEPANPRVLLLEAINTLHKPAFVGGGPDKALPQFVKAQEAFAAEKTAGGITPDWGRDDAFVWAGIAAMRLGDPRQAIDFYRKALEVTPDHGWVRGTLLPDAERALADSTGADGTGQSAPHPKMDAGPPPRKDGKGS